MSFSESQTKQQEWIRGKVAAQSAKFPKRPALGQFYIMIDGLVIPLSDNASEPYPDELKPDDQAMQDSDKKGYLGYEYLSLGMISFPRGKKQAPYSCTICTRLGTKSFPFELTKRTPGISAFALVDADNQQSILLEGFIDEALQTMFIAKIEWRVPIRTLTDPGKEEFCGLVSFSNQLHIAKHNALDDKLRASAKEFDVAIVTLQCEADGKQFFADFQVRTLTRDNIVRWIEGVEKTCQIFELNNTSEIAANPKTLPRAQKKS